MVWLVGSRLVGRTIGISRSWWGSGVSPGAVLSSCIKPDSGRCRREGKGDSMYGI